MAKTYRYKGRGSLVLDWHCPELGRIRRATHINNKKKVRNLLSMMDALYERGRLDVLTNIRDGVVSPMDVWQHYKTGVLNRVPSIATLRPLEVTEDWLETYLDIKETTRKSYRGHLKVFLNFAGRQEQIQALPSLLQRYKVRCAKNNTYRSFDVVRSVCQAYLNDKRLEGLWQDVKYIKPFRVEREERFRWKPIEFCELLDKLPPPHQAILQSLAFTGMMPSEYWGGRWSVEDHFIQIKGSKTKYRNGPIPKIVIPTTPQRQQLAFKRALAKHGNYVPYDCRRGYAYWMKEAEIPEARRNAYMRLKGSTILEMYQGKEVEDHLIEDARTLRAWFDSKLKPEILVDGRRLKPSIEPGSPFLRWA
jgi:integrase